MLLVIRRLITLLNNYYFAQWCYYIVILDESYFVYTLKCVYNFLIFHNI